MAIDARIVGFRIFDGETKLTLEPRDKYACAGQQTLVIVNTDDLRLCDLEQLVDCEIWGSSSTIMLGDTKIAERIGYTGIKLLPTWLQVVVEWKASHI